MAKERSAQERVCGDCTFCCKVMSIPELAKPQGVWCQHQARGCSVYAERPHSCSVFACQWLLHPEMPEAYRPDRTRVVLVAEGDEGRLVAHCDSATPTAWRREPIYSLLKDQAAVTWQSNLTVMAKAGQRLWLITPNAEIDLGVVDERSPLQVEKATDGTARVRALPPIAADEDVSAHLAHLRRTA